MSPADEWDTSDDPRRLMDLIDETLTLKQARLVMLGFIRQNLPLDRNQLSKWETLEQVALGHESEARMPVVFDYDAHVLSQRLLLCAQIQHGPADILRSPYSSLLQLFQSRAVRLYQDLGFTLARQQAGPPPDDVHPGHEWHRNFTAVYQQADRSMLLLLRCVFRNPHRDVAFDPRWRTSTAVGIAQQMYDARDFAAMPILADALQDAGCEDAAILGHCRGDGPHCRGCWVVDAVIGQRPSSVRGSS